MSAVGESIFMRRSMQDEENDSDIWDDTALIHAYDNAVSVVKAKLSESGITASVKESVPVRKKHKKRSKKNKNNAKSKWKVGDHCRAVYTDDGEIYEAVIQSINNASNTCSVRYLGYGNEEEHNIADLLPSEAVKNSNLDETISDSFTESDVGAPQQFSQKDTTPKDSRRNSYSSLNKGKSQWKNTQKSHQPNYSNFPPFANGMPDMPFTWPTSIPQSMPPPPPPPMSAPPFLGNFAPQPFTGLGHAPQMIPPFFPSMSRLSETPPTVPPMPSCSSDEDVSAEDQQKDEALHSMLLSWYMSGYHTGYYKGLKEASQSKKTASQSADTPSDQT